MADTVVKIGKRLLRGACVAATLAGFGCGGAVYEQRVHSARADGGDAASVSDSESEEPIELRVTREEINMGKDYVDALAAGRAAGAAARRAARAAGSTAR